jgi:gentisate 1,2-dioxygenase
MAIQSLAALTENGLYFEYTKAADPIGSGAIRPVPFAEFGAELHTSGPSRVVPLDLAEALQTRGPATSPALCANFVRILPGETVETAPNATSQLFYVMRGAGTTTFGAAEIPWKAQDFVALPAGHPAVHRAREESAFYLVHDEPLLRYLGVRADEPRFAPTLYTSERTRDALAKVAAEAAATERSRVSVLLAGREMDQTLTVTHTLWAMFGLLPVGAVQLPHRHQSVALDLILDCEPGCYTLVGSRLDEQKRIIDPRRVDWKPWSAFVTPPGQWHAHFNESGKPAHLIPLQDAGLQTYLRTLDIQFVLPPGKSRAK